MRVGREEFGVVDHSLDGLEGSVGGGVVDVDGLEGEVEGGDVVGVEADDVLADPVEE